jgi:hypothetical protein
MVQSFDFKFYLIYVTKSYLFNDLFLTTLSMCYKKMGQWPSNGKKEKRIAFGKSCVACHSNLGRGDSPTFATPLLSKFVTNKL